jgi:hypothetical protein
MKWSPSDRPAGTWQPSDEPWMNGSGFYEECA